MKKVTKIILGILGGFLTLIIILCVLAWKLYLNPVIEARDTVALSSSAAASSDKYKDVKYVAHRGASASAPENTLPAITLAGEKGYDGAEFDIYCTKDGKWVLMHDPFLFRMTDGFWQISKYTYEELCNFNFDNGANYKDYPSLKITLLSDALDECKKYGLTPYVEIKGSNTENAASLVELLNEKGFADCPVLSFQIEQLLQIKKLTDTHKLWYVVHKMTPEKLEEAKTLGDKAGIDFNASKEYNTSEITKTALSSGLEVGAWTIDDTQTLERVLDYGVGYITTNTIRPND